ncbi:MAG: TVP38/TMEM64 family protein [Firmicutes bacterium]|nr:TVP38/TMEM64 family protein [Bacillota bacterium]
MQKTKRQLSEKQKKAISAGAIGLFLLFTAAIFWFVGRPMLHMLGQPELFRDWVDGHGFWGRLAFIGMVVLQVFVAVIPGEPLEMAAGYAFGMAEGTLLCWTGAVLGSFLVFLFVRTWGMKAVEVFFPKEKIRSLRFLHRSPRRDALFFLIFLIPGTPKDLLSYVAGLTDMKAGTWLLISAVARLPSIITSTVGGDALGVQNYWFAAIVFGVTLGLSGLGLLIYRRICAAQQQKQGETPDECN